MFLFHCRTSVHQPLQPLSVATGRKQTIQAHKSVTVAPIPTFPLFSISFTLGKCSGFFISACLFILGNDLIRGFLVEHGALWLNGFMWSQSTQVCTAGRHFRSLSANPCGALGEKNHRLLLSLLLLFSLFYPQFFPSCKIIHFNRPTPFPLSLPLKLAIKRLTSLHTKRDVFEMQTNYHLGLLK